MLFKIVNKEEKSQFFKEIFLLTNFSIKVVLKMLFLILKNVEINFLELELFEKIYTFTKIIWITKQFELI